jgi:hypothetical protein
VIALWSVRATLYFLLVKDEERGMLGKFKEEYRRYMDHTGMFLPRGAESALGKLLSIPNTAIRGAVLLLFLSACTVGGAFVLRTYIVRHLPFWSGGSITALAILPEDQKMMDFRMASVLDLPEIRTRLPREGGPFLVYVMPVDYVMQGMIADTGGEWQLYKRHHTFAMIWDWIFHPFRHLESGHNGSHHHMGGIAPSRDGAGEMIRRMIFLKVDVQGRTPTPVDDFGIDARRSPLFVVNVDIHTLAVNNIRALPRETGWGKVPTPIF